MSSRENAQALPQSFVYCGYSCSFDQFIRGLSIRGYRQTVHIFCKQSANNLLLTDHNSLPINTSLLYTFLSKSHVKYQIQTLASLCTISRFLSTLTTLGVPFHTRYMACSAFNISGFFVPPA